MADYSVKTIAEVLLLDPRRVQQLSKEGIFPRKSRGQYDLIECVHGYIRFLRDQTRGRDPERVAEEKKITIENRKMKEMERGKQEKTLVSSADMERELAKLFTDVKTRIRSIAPKCAQGIAALKSTKKNDREIIADIQEILRKEHDDALTELSTWKP